MHDRLHLTRLEGRIGSRPFALVRDGLIWEAIIDGHCCGRYTGPHALANAIDALPVVMAQHPPEHPHEEQP